MKKLNVIIEKAENNYSAYIEEVDGVIATGKSIDDVKKNIVESIEVLIGSCEEFGCIVPPELDGEYTLLFTTNFETSTPKQNTDI